MVTGVPDRTESRFPFSEYPKWARGESSIADFRRWAEKSYERDSAEEPTLASW